MLAVCTSTGTPISMTSVNGWHGRFELHSYKSNIELVCIGEKAAMLA
jgi:hypothetical protein